MSQFSEEKEHAWDAEHTVPDVWAAQRDLITHSSQRLWVLEEALPGFKKCADYPDYVQKKESANQQLSALSGALSLHSPLRDQAEGLIQTILRDYESCYALLRAFLRQLAQQLPKQQALSIHLPGAHIEGSAGAKIQTLIIQTEEGLREVMEEIKKSARLEVQLQEKEAQLQESHAQVTQLKAREAEREQKEEAAGREKRALANRFLNTLPQPLQNRLPRLNFLNQLQAGFQAQAQQGTKPIQVIQGMGGLGKTQLAINYANQHTQDKDFVVWISADPLQLETQWLAFGEKLLGRDLKGIPKKEQLREIQQALSEHPNWLIVLDNVENEAALANLLPNRLLPTQQILITTRSAHWANYLILALEAFTTDESQAYFESRLTPDQCIGSAELAEALGHLPLAIAHATAYMQQTSKTAKGYLKLYQDKGIALLDKTEVKHEGRANTTVSTTYQISLTTLTTQYPQAALLLNACAYLHPDGIKKFILKALLPEDDEEGLDNCIRAIRQYSFLSKGKTGFKVHRLVQQAIRYGLSEEEQQVHIRRVARCLTKLYEEEGKRTPLKQEQYERALLPHLEMLLVHENLLPKETLAKVLGHLGHCYLGLLSEPYKSRDYLTRALAIDERHFGPNHTHVAITLMNLGNTYGVLGDVAKQRDLLARALAIFERHYGPDHPALGITLTNLAVAHRKLQQRHLALPMAQRTYRVLMTHPNYGAAHPTTKQCLKILQSTCQFSLKDLQGNPAPLNAATSVENTASARLFPPGQRRNPAAEEKASEGNQKKKAQEEARIPQKEKSACVVC